MTNTTKLKPVTSLYDLRLKTQTDTRYSELAISAARNLGGNPVNVDDAFRWFNLNLMETGEDEQAIVNEINFCI